MEKETTTEKQAQVIEVKHLLNKFRKEIDKQLEYLTRMAKRLKLAPPTWTTSEVYEHEFSVSLGSYGSGDQREEEVETYIEPCFDITLSVEDTLKIDGDWSFIGFIDHRNKSMFQLDEDITIPMKYSPSNDECEHCGKKYPRVKSYLVYNTETSEFKQVGKGCLKQFLGINPASYVTMFEAVSKFSPIIEGFGRKNKGGRMDNLAYDVDEMLRYTIHQVDKDGEFVKAVWEQVESGTDWRGDARYRMSIANPNEATICKIKERLSAISFFRLNPALRNDSTSIAELEKTAKRHTNRIALFEGIDKKNNEAQSRVDQIKDLLRSTQAHITAITYKHLLDEEIKPYAKDVASMKAFTEGLEIEMKVISEEHDADGKVIETKTTKSGFDDWKLKVKTVFGKDRTLQTNLSTIVSGYGFFLKQKAKAEADKERLANAENLAFVGTVGEKCELKLKVTDLKMGEGNYGTWYLWSMEDEDGNKFKKFGQLSSNHIIAKCPDLKETDRMDEGRILVGDTLHFLAEIKKHETYREEKQTMIGSLSKVKKVKYFYDDVRKERKAKEKKKAKLYNKYHAEYESLRLERVTSKDEKRQKELDVQMDELEDKFDSGKYE